VGSGFLQVATNISDNLGYVQSWIGGWSAAAAEIDKAGFWTRSGPMWWATTTLSPVRLPLPTGDSKAPLILALSRPRMTNYHCIIYVIRLPSPSPGGIRTAEAEARRSLNTWEDVPKTGKTRPAAKTEKCPSLADAWIID